MKRHFSVNGKSECGRGKVITEDVNHVTCDLCKNKPQWGIAWVEFQAKKEAAFNAQKPRSVREPWRDGVITCDCGSVLFREADRTCYGHYENFKCAACGENQSRLTEIGMSF